MVVGFVRQQLLQSQEQFTIRSVIQARLRGESTPESLYDVWLSYSTIDIEKNQAALANEDGLELLTHGLFDLFLGTIKSFHLDHYSEVHAVRGMISSFITNWRSSTFRRQEEHGLWWDGVSPQRTPGEPWISLELREDCRFFSLLEIWLEDGERLQTWLDGFEAETVLVNNPQDVTRVFSEENTTEVSSWAKVGRPGQLSLVLSN